MINWGILGTGKIAAKFAEDLQLTPNSHLLAVGSRTEKSAKSFSDNYNIPRHYADYQSLANDPDVDVIYVATPHTLHYQNSKMCIEAGKAVLCEKPLTVNASEARKLIYLAKEKNIFLMEAMWSRFMPIYENLRKWVNENQIGDIRMVQADFGFRSEWDINGRLLNRELGGGALLDVGIYPIDLSTMVFSRDPERIVGIAHMGETGVDEQSAMILQYDEGELAVLSCSIRTDTPREAVILGNRGSIRIEAPFWHSKKATITVDDEQKVVELPIVGNGYYYEAMEVISCLEKGKKESDVMPLSESLRNMAIMDELRSQWKLKYPSE